MNLQRLGKALIRDSNSVLPHSHQIYTTKVQSVLSKHTTNETSHLFFSFTTISCLPAGVSYPFKDETQAALFKDRVRTAL